MIFLTMKIMRNATNNMEAKNNNIINIKLVIAYDGAKYNGWQRLGSTANTIQGKFETLLEKLFGKPIALHASGRTDAGVHARGQVCNFWIDNETVISFCEDEKLPAIKNGIITDEHLHHIQKRINHYLPIDIRVLQLEEAQQRFHAQLWAKGKHYSYTIDNGEVAEIFLRRYVSRLEQPLDLSAIRKAIPDFIGEHDFTSFCTKSGKKKSAVRRIDKIEITPNGGLLRFDIYGNGFLYNMIRIIMGTLIEIGLGDRPSNDIPRILAAQNRTEAGYLAPAAGLCLEEVFY